MWGVWCFEFNDWMRGRPEDGKRKMLLFALEKDAKAFIRENGLKNVCEEREIEEAS